MPETQETDNDHNKAGNQKKRRPSAGLWFVLYGVLVLIGLAVGSWYFKNGADRAKFWVEGLLSAAVLSVVAVQAYIYRKQTEIMATTSVTSNRSYVGIHSIADRQMNDFEKMILIKLENIGKVPADDIRVRIHLDALWIGSDLVKTSAGLRTNIGEVIDKYFGRTKLFPGKLKIEIPIRYSNYFSDAETECIMTGFISLVVWGKIIYKDGFGGGNVTEFSFHRADDGRWLIHAPWPQDIIHMIEEGSEKKERGEAN
jgi:hypothetical protein